MKGRFVAERVGGRRKVSSEREYARNEHRTAGVNNERQNGGGAPTVWQ